MSRPSDSVAAIVESAEIKLDITPRTNYEFHDTLTFYLDENAAVLDIAANQYAQLQCIVTDQINFVRAESCVADDSSTPHTITVEIPEQMPITSASLTQVIIRYRFAEDPDKTDIYNYDGIVMPDTITEAYGTSWYLEAAIQSDPDGEMYKFTSLLFGSILEPVIWLGHYSASYINYLDLKFDTPNDLLVSDVIRVSLPTHNGLDEIFLADLGTDNGTGETVTLNCGEILADPTHEIKCQFVVPDISVDKNPVEIEISGIVAASSYIIRILGIKNPALAKDTVHDKTLLAKAKVSVVEKWLDFDLIKYEDEIFLYTNLESSTLTPITDTSATSDQLVTLTEFGSDGIDITFDSSITFDFADDGNSIIIMMDDAFTIPKYHIHALSVDCEGIDESSVSSHDSLKWILVEITETNADWDIDGKVMKLDSLSNLGFISADYGQPDPYEFTLYAIKNYILTEIHTIELDPFGPREPNSVTVTFQRSDIPRNYYDIYTITIDPVTTRDGILQRVDIFFPSQYQFIDYKCRSVSGVTSLDLPPLSCLSDCLTLPCTKHVILKNFEYNDDLDIVISIGAKSSDTAGAIDDLKVYLYASLDTSKPIEAKTDIQIGSGTIETYSSTYDFWVDWVQEDLYQRKIRASETGEIFLRIKPHRDIASGSTLKIVFPTGFGPATYGSPYCAIGEGDMYYDNFPLFWSRNYSHPISKNCI